MEKKKNKKMTKDNNRKNMIKTEKMTVTINLKMTDKEKKNKEEEYDDGEEEEGECGKQ